MSKSHPADYTATVVRVRTAASAEAFTVAHYKTPADGRAVDVFLSAAGARLAERLYGQVAQLLSPMISTLSHADRRRVQALLADMLNGR